MQGVGLGVGRWAADRQGRPACAPGNHRELRPGATSSRPGGCPTHTPQPAAGSAQQPAAAQARSCAGSAQGATARRRQRTAGGSKRRQQPPAAAPAHHVGDLVVRRLCRAHRHLPHLPPRGRLLHRPSTQESQRARYPRSSRQASSEGSRRSRNKRLHSGLAAGDCRGTASTQRSMHAAQRSTAQRGATRRCARPRTFHAPAAACVARMGRPPLTSTELRASWRALATAKPRARRSTAREAS